MRKMGTNIHPTALQRFARSMLVAVASLAGSPFRAAVAVTSAAVELCCAAGKAATAAPTTPDAELAQLSQQVSMPNDTCKRAQSCSIETC